MLRVLKNNLDKNAVLYLVIYAFLSRALLFFIYTDYSIYPDSGGYIDLGKQLSELDLSGYSGKRTPGYPSIIALVGNNLIIVKTIQLILGIISSFLIFNLIIKETRNKFIALVSTVFITSFVHLAFFEVAILTESLSLFVLVLTFWFIKTKKCLDSNIKYFNVFILSILFAYLYLIRPMFIYIAIVFALFYLIRNFRNNYKVVFYKSVLVLIIPLLTFYTWCSVNEKNIGVFGSTYYLGFNLTQTATSFFELVPEEHEEIRNVFIKHRDSLILNNPNKIPMSIWAAHDELITTTKLTAPQLSKKLGGISIELFKNHPTLYLKQVTISWLSFWKESILWKPTQIKSTFLKNILMGTWLYIQQWLAIGISILFIYFGFKTIISVLKNRFRSFDFNLFLVLIVLLGSFAQAMITYGSNDRFSFPYFPLIVYFVIINLLNSKQKNAAHS